MKCKFDELDEFVSCKFGEFDKLKGELNELAKLSCKFDELPVLKYELDYLSCKLYALDKFRMSSMICIS